MSQNPKSLLNEYCLKRFKSPPKYSTVRTPMNPGPDHAPRFTCTLTLPDLREWHLSRGDCSKAELEFKLANVVLHVIDREEPELRQIEATVVRLTRNGAKASIANGGGMVTISGDAADGISVGDKFTLTIE